MSIVIYSSYFSSDEIQLSELIEQNNITSKNISSLFEGKFVYVRSFIDSIARDSKYLREHVHYNGIIFYLQSSKELSWLNIYKIDMTNDEIKRIFKLKAFL